MLLLIEVADTSQEIDRRVKAPLYARASIVKTWVVEVATDVIEVHRRPAPAGYREVRAIRRGETFTIECLPDVRFATDDLLG